MATPLPMFTQGQQPLVGIEAPHDNDVLCGRGVTTNRHVGNENFRSLVNCNKELYVTSTKRQKMTISRSIVDAVRTLEPPGRFLEKDSSTGRWYDIGDKKAVEKTSQALRDGAACLRKQLSEDLTDPDFLSAVFDMDDQMFKETPKGNSKPTKMKDKKIKAKQAPAKGHRRTKSNPPESTAAKAKAAAARSAAAKKQRNVELTSSPRATQKSRHSLHLPQVPKPLQSPMSTPSSPAAYSREGRAHSLTLSADSPQSFSAHLGASPPQDSPRFFRHGHYTFDGPNGCISSSRSFEMPTSPCGRQSSQEIPPPLHDAPMSPPQREHSRPIPPRPFPSPLYSGHRGPQPTSPSSPSRTTRRHHSGTPMSPPPSGPLPPGIHRLSPAGYQQQTISSPPATHRSSRHSPYGSRQSLTPHPYQHPSDRQDYRRTPEYQSPRQGYGRYNSQSSGLTVPTLGGESQRGYDRQGHLPISPVQSNPRSYLRHRPQTTLRPRPEFLPPPSSASPRRSNPERVMSASPLPAYPPSPRAVHPLHRDSGRRNQEFHHRQTHQERRGDDVERHSETNVFVGPSRVAQTNFEDSLHSGSPSGVVDSVEVVLSSESDDMSKSKSPIIHRKSSKEEEREEPDLNPASDGEDDDMVVSPVPFEGNSLFGDPQDQDESSLLDLPENLLSLPISPCAPSDIS